MQRALLEFVLSRGVIHAVPHDWLVSIAAYRLGLLSTLWGMAINSFYSRIGCISHVQRIPRRSLIWRPFFLTVSCMAVEPRPSPVLSANWSSAIILAYLRLGHRPSGNGICARALRRLGHHPQKYCTQPANIAVLQCPAFES